MTGAALTVRAYPRIHITLVDLAGATLRVNGGVGFAVDALPTTATASRSDVHALTVPSEFDAQAHADIEAALIRLRSATGHSPTKVSVVSPAHQHVGLGTKTSTVLAALKAVALLHHIRISDVELQRLTGRGGTSGVGLATFFTGGLVADAGRPASIGHLYKPSSAALFDSPAVAIVQMKMPATWRCHLILPPGNRRSGFDESRFFDLNTPINKAEALQVLAAVYHGICPAVATGDFPLFRRALLQIQDWGFKRREIQGQPTAVAQLIRRLNTDQYLASGMSGMGPMIFVLQAGGNERDGYVSSICSSAGSAYLGCFDLRNSGFERLE